MQRFNEKNPAYQGMYYRLLADTFAAEAEIRNTQVFREYEELYSGMFSRINGIPGLHGRSKIMKAVFGAVPKNENEEEKPRTTVWYTDFT